MNIKQLEQLQLVSGILVETEIELERLRRKMDGVVNDHLTKGIVDGRDSIRQAINLLDTTVRSLVSTTVNGDQDGGT